MDSDEARSEVREILHHLGTVVGALLLSHGFDLLIQWQGIEGIPLWSMKFSQLVLILIAVGAFLESLEHVSNIWIAAWRVREFRVALSIVLLISAFSFGMWAYGMATDPPEPHSNEIEELQEDREESLAAAAEADDTEEVQKHVEEAETAKSQISRYRFVHDVHELVYWLGGVVVTGILLIVGLVGLILREEEVFASGA